MHSNHSPYFFRCNINIAIILVIVTEIKIGLVTGWIYDPKFISGLDVKPRAKFKSLAMWEMQLVAELTTLIFQRT